MSILLTEIEIQTLADEADENADQQIQCPGEYHPDWHSVRDSIFARAIQLALIEKMRKEPVAWNEFDAWYAETGWRYVSSREGAFVVWKAARAIPTPQELEES